jgi:hypothetical protein
VREPPLRARRLIVTAKQRDPVDDAPGAEPLDREAGVRNVQLDSATMPMAGRSRMSVPAASIRNPFTAVSKNE